MARPPLLQLSGIELGFGGNPLFSGLDLTVHPGDRMALVGRNGSGKSTLLKVMAALVEPDAGQRAAAPGTHVGYMEQDPDLSGFETLGAFATADLGPEADYKVEKAAAGLKLSLDTEVRKASGGERRRAALARLLAREPELMLLDEPTNHLDIEAITWLEDHLKRTRAAYVLISHDRSFLSSLAKGLLWVDRGVVRRLDKGFAAFEAWRDKTWEEEDLARHKLDRKIKAEARWAVEGISARRTRNQGRVRALGELRRERSEMIRRQGTAAMALDAGTSSGRMVIEATEVTKVFDERAVLKPFSLRVMRGDRIAIVGPNGAGKTTALKLLTGELTPDSGSVRHGTNLEVAIFDQNRSALDPDATLWDSLTGDPEMRVSGKADQVMVRGTAKHVVGYLKEFLFSDAQARSPVRSLSGGEKARLLLARIMARPSNLLVLDEPTNDLDIETLDLLQEILSDYPGTVILVSHDRDFIDRVASTTLFMPGDGTVTAYAGGWSDMLAQRGTIEPSNDNNMAPARTAERKTASGAKSARNGLSFAETHRLKELPDQIERLEGDIRKLSDLLADPALYTRDPAKFKKASEALAERQKALSDAEEDWLDLEERASQQ